MGTYVCYRLMNEHAEDQFAHSSTLIHFGCYFPRIHISSHFYYQIIKDVGVMYGSASLLVVYSSRCLGV